MIDALDKWRRYAPETCPAPDATPDDVADRVRSLVFEEGMTVATEERYGVWHAAVMLGAPPNIAGFIPARGNTEPEALAAAWAEHLRVEANRDAHV